MKERKLLANWVMCPDGTMLPSFHVHDYRSHETIDEVKLAHPDGIPEPHYTDEAYSDWYNKSTPVTVKSRMTHNDGGLDYLRRGGKYTEMSVYSDDPFEVIRRFVCRETSGTYVPLMAIPTEKLIEYIEHYELENADYIYLPYYGQELEYRKNGK